MGLISAHHELGQDSDAIGDVEKMPPAAYESALGDPGFLSMLGAIYQQANQFEVAQGLLERSEKLQIASGGQPSVALQLQLAAIYLLRNNTDKAYAVYRQVLTEHPDRADAWKGLIDTLAATNRNAQALDEISHIPAPARKQLDADIDFVQTEASLYEATGDTARAVQYMNRVEAYYAKLKELPPAKIEIQNAWLLYNIGDDRALYPALMRLGGRSDLTAAQREMVQNIWANWSVRRAAAAMDNGNVQRAVDILDAASQAFPNNMTVRKAVAGGYARVGRAKEAVALFKTVPMQDASAGDFEGAVGAALAANDKNQAEIWLRQALDRFPTDPAVLTLAARYEQARGDNERAADYYRASLAAMPKTSPVDRLAHVLVYPEQSTKAHRAVTAADLQRLLNPDYEPFAKTAKLPPLPAYGPDPYNGGAPVVLPQTQPSQPAPQAPPSGSAGPGSENQPITMPVPNAAVDPGPSAYGAHVVLASWHCSRPVFRGKNGFLSFGLGSPAAIQSSPIPSGAIPSRVDAYSQVEITANPPHSLASDAWKGLVFSLVAGDRNAEALDELSKIPPDVRRQLEADIEWVQGIASLYSVVNDIPHATYYFKRVENFYVLHRTPVPAGLEVQHAWLLYNMKDDAGLYSLLQRLNARPDLTAAQRQQVETLSADWAVRRAGEAMDGGHLPRGVEILEAASQDYPDNMIVRRAAAGAYARVGRSQDALTLFKTVPMDEASSGDFQGAIGSALAATDMAQAEAWLRIALSRYPNDPNILGLAARFEQARGNNERASTYWRAAIAAMPQGSSMKSLDYGLALVFPAPIARPRHRPQLRRRRDRTAPRSGGPLAAPPLSLSKSPDTHTFSGQGTAPANPPVYAPPGASRNNAPSSPVLIEQSARQSDAIDGKSESASFRGECRFHRSRRVAEFPASASQSPARKARLSPQTCEFRRSPWTPRQPRLRSSLPFRPIASSRRAPHRSFTPCPMRPSARCPMCRLRQLPVKVSTTWRSTRPPLRRRPPALIPLPNNKRTRSSPLPRRQNRRPAQPQPSTSGRRRTSRPRRPSATRPLRVILLPRAPSRPVKEPRQPRPSSQWRRRKRTLRRPPPARDSRIRNSSSAICRRCAAHGFAPSARPSP